MKNKYSICTRCVSDLSIPNIIFDENGECQYCKIHDEMEREYPFNDKSFDNLIQISKK